MACATLFILVVASAGAGPAPTVSKEPSPGLRASLRADRAIIQAGRSVWVEFSITNLLDRSMTLRVSEPEKNAEPEKSDGVGLPLGHVFGADKTSAVSVVDKYGKRVSGRSVVRAGNIASPVKLAPQGSVGLRLDLTRYFEALKRPGEYVVLWQPYGAKLVSEPLNITILPERQAVILTDHGKITMRFYYDAAPNHVQNFIELIEQRFYDGLTFHRVVPGGLLQGGDPQGDGHGVRPNGKRLKAEFSDLPFEYGTVGMARTPRDRDSASCQFFICLSRQPSFDGQQTAFAYVVYDESFETLRHIAAVPTGPRDRPLRPVYIRAISLENVPVREREQPVGVKGDSSRSPGQPKPPVDTDPVAKKKPAANAGLRAIRPAKTASRPAGETGG